MGDARESHKVNLFLCPGSFFPGLSFACDVLSFSGVEAGYGLKNDAESFLAFCVEWPPERPPLLPITNLKKPKF